MGTDRIAFLMVVQTVVLVRLGQGSPLQGSVGLVGEAAKLTDDEILAGLGANDGDFEGMATEFIEWQNGGEKPEWMGH